jgi:hypothetical protein
MGWPPLELLLGWVMVVRVGVRVAAAAWVPAGGEAGPLVLLTRCVLGEGLSPWS